MATVLQGQKSKGERAELLGENLESPPLKKKIALSHLTDAADSKKVLGLWHVSCRRTPDLWASTTTGRTFSSQTCLPFTTLDIPGTLGSRMSIHLTKLTLLRPDSYGGAGSQFNPLLGKCSLQSRLEAFFTG